MFFIELTKDNGLFINVCIDHIVSVEDRFKGSILALSNHEYLEVKEEASEVIDLIKSNLYSLQSAKKD